MTIEKTFNERGAAVYSGVSPSTYIGDLDFTISNTYADDMGSAVNLHTNIGSLTVVDRMTGFGFRDIETGYRDMDGYFWLASGNYDVRESGCKTIGHAIEWIKSNANTCVAVAPFKNKGEVK